MNSSMTVQPRLLQTHETERCHHEGNIADNRADSSYQTSQAAEIPDISITSGATAQAKKSKASTITIKARVDTADSKKWSRNTPKSKLVRALKGLALDRAQVTSVRF